MISLKQVQQRKLCIPESFTRPGLYLLYSDLLHLHSPFAVLPLLSSPLEGRLGFASNAIFYARRCQSHFWGMFSFFFAILQFGAFFICLVGEKNVRNMERYWGLNVGFVVWELEEKGLFRFFPPLLIFYDVGFPCLFGW